MRRAAVRIIVPLASLALAALIGEALLRWVFHAAPLLDLDIYYLDEGRRLRMQPGARRRHVTRQWDVSIAINQEGFRDRAVPVASPAPPVLGLGDSFAFGWGVNLEDSYLYRLEQSLNANRPIRVVKAGINGTGTGDQFKLLEAIGDRYRPQMVLLSFFGGNDFTDVQMGGVDQFEVQDGLLVRRELGPRSRLDVWRQNLVRSSHLLQFLRAVQWTWERGRAAGLRHEALAARDPWLS
ncbi:MAG: SGNH/GDSL hydrolase family protein, partial [Acidobacteria bacterium]|nr:SGNH/GDSL hydrolase family protein [Acidobacteriota bacterium]